jgi:YHS domain-containing protein
MTGQRQNMKEPARQRGLQKARMLGALVLSAIAMAAFATVALKGPMALVDPALASTSERLVVDRFTGLALGGIDPVAYFTDAKMLTGRPDVEARADGAIWRFQNEDNRAYFLANPEVYAPQFGGYDSVDVARGVAVAGVPRLWLIHRERLYLFSREENQAAFATDPEKVLRDANDKWLVVVETLAQ